MTDPAGTQRHYRAPCPSCGAPVQFKSAQSAYAVCSYCQSTVARDGDALARIGKMADLFDDHSLLQPGVSGRIDGQAFELVGRLQYRYPEGTWSEWYALLADGSPAWLSEDNGAYVFSLPLAGDAPPAASLHVGATAVINGHGYTVASSVTASLIAAQGELPRLPPLGQPFAVVELRSQGGSAAAQRVLSIDYGSQPPALTEGRAVELAALQLSGLKDESARQDQGRQFACPNCGAPVQVRLEQSQSITCPQCRTLIDLSAGIGGQLRHARQNEQINPQIALGSVGQLDGAAWQVVGFQARAGRSLGDDESFYWQEYLLYNATRGFVFLVDAQDGWSLVRTLTGAPQLKLGGATAIYDGVTYKKQEQIYRAETTYVIGEFYWQVQRGQITTNCDYAAGDKLLSSEKSASEVTWSGGRKISALTVSAAFKQAMRADARPFSAAPQANIVSIIIILVVMVFVLSLLSQCSTNSSNTNGGTGYGAGTAGGSFGGYSSGGGHK